MPPKHECLFHTPPGRVRAVGSLANTHGLVRQQEPLWPWSLPFGPFSFVHPLANCRHSTEPGTGAAHDAEQRLAPAGTQPASLPLCIRG